jgi:hypothetical protein
LKVLLVVLNLVTFQILNRHHVVRHSATGLADRAIGVQNLLRVGFGSLVLISLLKESKIVLVSVVVTLFRLKPR